MELIESPDKISSEEFMVECTCHCSLLRFSIFDKVGAACRRTGE